MRLSERIDQALQRRHLFVPTSMSNAHVEEHREELISPVQEHQSSYQTLNDAIEHAETIHPDEDGLRICIVSTIDVKNISLPLKVGKYIVEDIQPFNAGGYEVHLAEASSQRQ